MDKLAPPAHLPGYALSSTWLPYPHPLLLLAPLPPSSQTHPLFVVLPSLLSVTSFPLIPSSPYPPPPAFPHN